MNQVHDFDTPQYQQDWAEAFERAAQVFAMAAPTDDDWRAFCDVIAKAGCDMTEFGIVTEQDAPQP